MSEEHASDDHHTTMASLAVHIADLTEALTTDLNTLRTIQEEEEDEIDNESVRTEEGEDESTHDEEEGGVSIGDEQIPIHAQSMAEELLDATDDAIQCMLQYTLEAARQNKDFHPQFVELLWKLWDSEGAGSRLDLDLADFEIDPNTLDDTAGLTISVLKIYATEALKCGAPFDRFLLQHVRNLLRSSSSAETRERLSRLPRYEQPRDRRCSQETHKKSCPDYPLLTDTVEVPDLPTREVNENNAAYHSHEIESSLFTVYTLHPLEYCIVEKMKRYLTSLAPDVLIHSRILQLCRKLYLLKKGKAIFNGPCDEFESECPSIVEDSLLGNLMDYYTTIWFCLSENQGDKFDVSDEVFEAVKGVLERTMGDDLTVIDDFLAPDDLLA